LLGPDGTGPAPAYVPRNSRVGTDVCVHGYLERSTLSRSVPFSRPRPTAPPHTRRPGRP